MFMAGCATLPPTVSVSVTVGRVGAVPAHPGQHAWRRRVPRRKAAAQAALIETAAWEGYASRLEVVLAGCH
jgi:hypothetical protein